MSASIVSPPESATKPSEPAKHAPESAELGERVYPTLLARHEADLIKQRQKFASTKTASPIAPLPEEPVSSEAEARVVVQNACGLAFSGGGIRSATFCLGVAQELAKRNVLQLFDFLSTVSGGGYCGGFLGKLVQERGDRDIAYKEIQDSQSRPVNWLRESGYYLAPGGSSDLWRILALLLRNWAAVQFVLGTFLFLPFLFADTIRRGLWNWECWRQLEQLFIPNLEPYPPLPFVGWDASGFAVSPWFLPVAALFVVGMLLPGAMYWTTQLYGNTTIQERHQGLYTRWLAFGTMLTTGALLVAAMDTAAIWIYSVFQQQPTFWAGFGAVYVLAAAGFGWVQKFAGKLTAIAADPGKSPSMFTIAKIAGVAWALLFWLLLAVLGQILLWCGKGPGFTGADLVRLGGHWPCMLLVSLGWLVALLILARVYSFVNLSSLHQYYSARLSRAYLGASNQQRGSNQPVSESHQNDDCAWRQYRPDRYGGPLHIVNVTLNETVSGKSQIEQIDRKGLAFALGPAGISVSGIHHALWDGTVDTGATSPVSPLKAIAPDPSVPFHIFPAARAATEELWLGDWIGISGAAFSTGMGAQTSLGLGLLLGFANIRLGYWWDSGIDPKQRNATRDNHLILKCGGIFARLFPTPCSLLDELLTRFHGPARQRWYLSDGGHYENTACYELLRRRVGFILCLDCGQDADMAFEDLGGLVRKARIDFDAEIEFVADEEPEDDGGPCTYKRDQQKLQQTVRPEIVRETLNQPQIPEAFKKLNPKLIGLPREFTSFGIIDGKPIQTSGKRHAMLARVCYGAKPKEVNGQPDTVILFLKPSLTGDEPLDVRQYHTSNAEFPQQSTMDQFFDESQWESYRRLGEHIADHVLTPEATSADKTDDAAADQKESEDSSSGATGKEPSSPPSTPPPPAAGTEPKATSTPAKPRKRTKKPPKE